MNGQVAALLFLVEVPGALLALWWTIRGPRDRTLHLAVAMLMFSGWPRRMAWLLGGSLPEWATVLVLPLLFVAGLAFLLWTVRRA